MSTNQLNENLLLTNLKQMKNKNNKRKINKINDEDTKHRLLNNNNSDNTPIKKQKQIKKSNDIISKDSHSIPTSIYIEPYECNFEFLTENYFDDFYNNITTISSEIPNA